jgi:hypothetical protein
MGRVGAIVAFALLAAGTLTAAPALAAEGEGCPNEQVRPESNTNPATGQPYSMGLPECRAYEMVSPLEKGGSDVAAGNGVPAAADGEAVGFVSEDAFGGAENAVIGALGTATDSYIARRRQSGWATSSSLAPRDLIAHPGSNQSDASPEDLSTMAECGLTVVNNLGAGTSAVCAVRETDGSWLSTPDYSNLTGAVYGNFYGERYPYSIGGSSDLSDVVFESEGTAGAAFLPADTSTGNGEGLYEVAGLGGASPELRLVNVDESGNEIGPNNGSRVGGITGSNGEAVACAAVTIEPITVRYQAISSDGATIYFTACPSNETGGANEIYARVDGTSTVAISNPSPSQCTTCSAPEASAAYEGASADGSKAFFMTKQPLVNEDEGGTGTGNDLYEYDFDNPPGKNLVQLSAGGAGDLTPGSGAEVQGVVRTSSDGSHVYFVAKGVLTTVPNGVGEVAQAGADNLYAVDTISGQTGFVGELCSNKDESGSVKDTQCPATLNGNIEGGLKDINDSALWGEDASRQAQTTPDGRYLVFTTYAKLITAGSEADTNEAQQVYRYDFETGALVRVSVGEPSFPASHNGNAPGMNSAVAPLPSGGSPASSLGAFADISDLGRAISDDGSTIVFSTPESLQADDTNTGTNPSCAAARQQVVESEHTGCDVYEWHECTSGTCEDGMTGETNMISPGDGASSSDTVDGRVSMSASGSDIFFFTRTELVGQDTDQLTDVYDARLNGGFPAPTPESSCSGEGCQGGASTGPALGASGTSSFTGGGNLTPGSTTFPPPTATGKVSIGKHSVKGSTITLSVKAPAGGHISASGSGVASVKRSVSKSGTYVLKATLTRAGKASLRKHHRLKLNIRVAFTPTSGQASAAAITITVKT